MSGRVVIVTGGASGIGWAVCQRFAAAGDTVVIADIDRDLADCRVKALEGEGIAIPLDVSDAGEISAAVSAVLDRFGRVDVLVNNAAILEPTVRPFVDQPVGDIRRLLGVNIAGMRRGALIVAKAMGDRGGAIVNLASCGGFVAVPSRVTYGSTKAAIGGLTRDLALEWASRGVRVNAVAPGYTATELQQGLVASGSLKLDVMNRRVPLGRAARPAEIAEALFFLASSEASFVTGATLVADGGLLAFGGSGHASVAKVEPFRAPDARVVLIVGADAIGRAIAKHIAVRGDRVVVLDPNLARATEAAEGLGGGALPLGADLSDEAAVNEAVKMAVEKFGRIDTLIDNAFDSDTSGVAEPEDALLRALVVAKVVGRSLLDGGGAVVYSRSRGSSNTSLVEEAVVMLARSLACEWAPARVRVNAMVHAAIDVGDTEISASMVPMQRLGRPDELAKVAAFLASDAASYITGAVLRVDGGIAITR